MAVVNLKAKIFNCSNSIDLAKKLSKSFGTDLGNITNRDQLDKKASESTIEIKAEEIM